MRSRDAAVGAIVGIATTLVVVGVLSLAIGITDSIYLAIVFYWIVGFGIVVRNRRRRRL